MNELTVEQKKYVVWFDPLAYLGLDGKSPMTHLFNRLAGAYPYLWKANFPNNETMDNWIVTWAEGFEEAGLRPHDLKAGIKALGTKFERPPTLAEFIRACKPSVDSMVAYYEAVAGVQARKAGEVGVWSHPAIFWAARGLSFDLGNQTYSQIKIRWESALNEQMDRGEWEPIPEPTPEHLRLSAPGKGALSRENAAKMIEELGAQGILEKKDTEHRAWIGKILARHKAKDQTLPYISYKFALQAINL